MGIRACFRLKRGAFRLEVDLDLQGQGVTALFGHSGSGKTSLLRLIAGLERAPGFLEVNGQIWQQDEADIFLPSYHRSLGYVFQEARLFPHLSVRKNLEYGLKRVPPAQRRLGLPPVLDLLGLGHLLERRPEHLSGGERQRVAIARALLTSPRVLLLDEPLSALDLLRKQEILPYLERLRAELEIPLIYVSHAPDEVARLADYLVVMDEGRALAQGPLTETLARLDLPIRLGEDAGVVLDAEVVERDSVWGLALVRFDGGAVWVRDSGHPLGQPVRVRILARDVSLTQSRHGDTSILNILPAMVTEIATDTHPALALVRLQVGTTPVLARLTHRSADALALSPGKPVFVQIKTAALIG